MRKGQSARVIEVSNEMKSRIAKAGHCAVTPAMIKHAESVLADMADGFVERARRSLLRLNEAYDRLSRKPSNPEILAEINAIFYDLQGQAGMFGYPLLTQISRQICGFIDSGRGKGPMQVHVIKLHIDAAALMMDKDEAEQCDGVAEEVLSGLKKVIERVR
ncbi:MAG: hypothetical protein KIT00_00170 [Rhodospirillales bacterium]|nr:hypothetical protein [Rhodospirillales bacterium]